MNAKITSNHKLVKRIKAASFDKEKLPSYSLCLQIGVRDFQAGVINKQTNTCLFLEDYLLENIKTINTRLEAIRAICESHPILKADLWDSIKVSFKSHKFSLVPAAYFLPESASDYLALNSEIKVKIEDVYYFKHISSSAINIFTTDKKVTAWAKEAYPLKGIQVIHQGSALIEGILTYRDHSHEKTMFAYFDRGILHLAVAQNQKLLYYNQFAVQKSQDYLKYVMLVFRELQLTPKTNKLIVWGLMKTEASPVKLLQKYIRNISYGERPHFLKFPSEFNDVEHHRYFDLFSISLCE